MADLYYIEDDSSIALAVKEYLELKGFRVTICATSASFSRIYQDRSFCTYISCTPIKFP